jgi:hypothetical protein
MADRARGDDQRQGGQSGNTQKRQFIMAVSRPSTGRGRRLRQEMYPDMKLGLRWLFTDMDQNHNLFRKNCGIRCRTQRPG